MNPTDPRFARLLRYVSLGLFVLAAIAAAWLVRVRYAGRSAQSLGALAATVAGGTQGMHERRKANRLAHEKSPYLLQHAYNPVDWYPWGEEAFAKAKREDKPIFLSIGYSTCHWCHVMEPSRSRTRIAVLNETTCHEGRPRGAPDVDQIYMTACGRWNGRRLAASSSSGSRAVFMARTSRPTSMGRPGMMDVLPRVHDAWLQHRDQVVASGRSVIEAIDTLSAREEHAADRESLFLQCERQLAASFDRELGGFSTAPKFPSIVNLNFLMRWWARDREHHAEALEMVRRQLDAMRAGGIHDHLGGGFHRYSTDREWLTPHFEKMLYDQAEIAWAYLEGYQATGEPTYAATARDIFSYVTRELSAPEGGFYSAEDADSEGEEGRFYVWTPEEIETIAGAEDARPFLHRYGVTNGSNFEHGTSILHEAHTLAETAAATQLSEAEVRARIERVRHKLFVAREKRVRPHRDDKVLTAWNGLMISAFARGARVWDARARARRCAATGLGDKHANGALARRWRAGEAGAPGQMDDYAYLALGLVDLYQAGHDPVWLDRAAQVVETMVARFWDPRDGGFFESPAGDVRIRVRMKDGFDGAEMAGNSIAALDLQLLGTLLDRSEWLQMAHQTFDYYSRRLATGAAAMPQMLVAMELASATPRHIVIAGAPGGADTRAMVGAFDRRFLPHDVLLLADGGARQKALAALAPFVAPLAPRNGRATAYVCVGYACRLPTDDLAAFSAQLDERTLIPRGSRP